MTPIISVKIVPANGHETFQLEIVPASRRKNRLKHFKTGTYLDDIKKGDVIITQKALDLLLIQPARDDISNSLEFWMNRMIAWPGKTSTAFVAVHDVDVHPKAKSWMRELIVVTS